MDPSPSSSCTLTCSISSSASSSFSPASTQPPLLLPFEPDETKKNSAFWLRDPPSTIEGPVTLVIEATSSGAFVLGGFQLVSNSKMIEVHLQKDDPNSKEYLTTCRGVGNPPKATCVIPGGPKLVRRLYLELKSLQAEKDGDSARLPLAQIASLKLTARINDAKAEESKSVTASVQNPGSISESHQPSPASTSMRLPFSSPPQQNLGTSFPSGEDISSALAAVSMMVRATEDRVTQEMARQLSQERSKHEQHLERLTRLILEQRVCLEQQSRLLTIQSDRLQQQTHQMQQLRQGQEDIIRSIDAFRLKLDSTSTESPTAALSIGTDEDQSELGSTITAKAEDYGNSQIERQTAAGEGTTTLELGELSPGYDVHNIESYRAQPP